jgi:hypothetical protein
MVMLFSVFCFLHILSYLFGPMIHITVGSGPVRSFVLLQATVMNSGPPETNRPSQGVQRSHMQPLRRTHTHCKNHCSKSGRQLETHWGYVYTYIYIWWLLVCSCVRSNLWNYIHECTNHKIRKYTKHVVNIYEKHGQQSSKQRYSQKRQNQVVTNRQKMIHIVKNHI